MKILYWLGSHICYCIGDLISRCDQFEWFEKETEAFQDKWYRLYCWWMIKSYELDEKIGFKIWKVSCNKE